MYFSDLFEGNSHESCLCGVLFVIQVGACCMYGLFVPSTCGLEVAASLTGITLDPLDWPFDPEVFILGHSWTQSCAWKKEWTQEHEKVKQELKKLAALVDWRGI